MRTYARLRQEAGRAQAWSLKFHDLQMGDRNNQERLQHALGGLMASQARRESAQGEGALLQDVTLLQGCILAVVSQLPLCAVPWSEGESMWSAAAEEEGREG